MKTKKSKKNHIRLKIGVAALFLAGAAVFLERLAKAAEEPESINDDNPYLDGPYAGTDWDDADALMQECEELTLYERFGKRALDKVVSFFGLVALAPLFGLIAVAIEIDDPGPVLFKQKRVGKDKNFFEIHKFRTMKRSAPTNVPIEKFEDQEEYITRVGRFLRNTYLDELPQLWDVFRGRMSLVGPRPVIWNTKELIEEREKYGANSVRPGITGIAQINGGNTLDNIKKAQLDGQYVKTLRESNLGGFLADLNCLAETAGVLNDSNDE
ncbi:MAG: sugar transferase [Firmicutes bacterium]|nr:sugar transferase [Bacillota bacterium]